MIRIRFPDIAVRILSVILALVLWFAVAAQKNAVVNLEIPIEFRNLPRGLEIVGPAPQEVRVWLRGSPGFVQKLRPGEVFVPVNLAGATVGSRVLPVAAAEVSVPYGVRTMAVDPALLTLILDRTVRRALPVKPPLVGTPAPGFRVAGVSCEPAEALVSGPERGLAVADGIPTLPVSVAGARMTLVVEVSLLPPPGGLRIVEPAKARVTVVVAPQSK